MDPAVNSAAVWRDICRVDYIACEPANSEAEKAEGGEMEDEREGAARLHTGSSQRIRGPAKC